MDESDPSLWFRDRINPDFVQLHRIRETVYSAETGFQSAQVVDTNAFGRCLVLDGKFQSAEMDEFIYHEALVHPAMIVHPDPRTVFVAGGGEGSTAREILRYQSVEKVVMIDIDQEVVDICRRFLPNMHQGAFDDSRLKLVYADAREYLANTDETFDVVIIDLSEPVEGGPSYLLYTREFYSLVGERLTDDGVVAVQSGSCCLGDLDVFVAINSTLSTVFPLVFPYQAYVPSFGGLWGFALAFRGLGPAVLPLAEVDSRISSRVQGRPRFYDGISHQGMFCMPLYIREELGKGNTVITDGNPLFLH